MRKLHHFRSRVKLSIAIATMLIACEKAPPNSAPSSPELPVPENGTFAVGAIKIAPSQTVMQSDAMMKNSDLEACIARVLNKSSAFKDGKRTVSGTVTYDLQETEGSWVIAMFGILSEERDDGATAEASGLIRSNDARSVGKTKLAASELLCEEVAARAATQFVVAIADVAKLSEILADASTERDAKLRALQEIRERKLSDAIPSVVPFIEHEDPEIAVTAAATLAGLDHFDSRGKALALAERLSRNQNPQYVPMLHVLAEFGGPAAIAYLETVSRNHDNEAIRTIATKALRSAR